MKCFVHRTEDAVGLCKHCSRGICGTCSADLGDGLACAGRCEAKVQSVNTLIERNVRATKTRLRGGYVYIVLGALFLIMGATMFDDSRTLGVTFAVVGVAGIWFGWRVNLLAASPADDKLTVKS